MPSPHAHAPRRLLLRRRPSSRRLRWLVTLTVVFTRHQSASALLHRQTVYTSSRSSRCSSASGSIDSILKKTKSVGTAAKCTSGIGVPDTLLSMRGGGAVRGPSDAQRRRLTVLLVATALFNDTLQLTMLLPIIHTLVTSPPPLGVTANGEIALGLFFASKDICQLSFAPLAGILTSRTSPKAALAVSTAGLGLATFVFADATTFRQLLLARGAQGAASAAVLCGGLSLIAETHPAEVRGSAIGLAYTGLALGLLCGPLVGGLLFESMGRRRTFRLAAAIVLANALAQVALMGLAPAPRCNPATSDKESNSSSPGKGSALASSRALLANGDVLAVAAATLAVHAVVGVIKPLSQVVLDREFGMSMVSRSFVITIATVTYFISTPLAGWMSDHMPRSRLVALSLLLMALSTAFFALRGLGLWAFNICIGLLGTSLGIAGSAGQSLLADLVDRHNLGEYSMAFALSDMADSLGLILGPLLGLAISQMLGPSAGAGFVGIFCLILAPIVLRIP